MRKLEPVISHQSAAVHWTLDLLTVPERQHLTVPRCRSRLLLDGAVVHRLDLADCDVTEDDGVAVTTPLRTIQDLGRSLPLREAVALADSALRRRSVKLRELQALAGRTRGRGAGRLGRAISLVNPLSESFLESACRILLTEAGLAPPQLQYEVRRRGLLIARVDLAWPERRLAVELDGFAFHADREQYRNDRRRLNALELAGWRVLRFSWEDVVANPSYVVATVTAALLSPAVA